MTALMLTMAVTFSASCGDTSEPMSGTTADDTSALETTTDTTIAVPDLPEADFDGATLNFLVRGESAEPTNFSHEIYAAEENGDTINDAVFRRNIAIQERYNVVITETADNDTVEAVRTSVLANDGAYDVVMVRPNRMVTLAAEGLLCDLWDFPYIDPTAEWWDQNTVEYLTVNDRLYFMNGDINIMDNNAIWACMFNKRLFDEYSLEYPYDAVKDGTWTLDKFIELARVGGKDLNGDGIMDETDQYGLITANENIYPLIVSGGETISGRASDGSIVIDPDLEAIHSLLDKIIALTSDDTVTLIAERYQNKGYTNVWSEVMRASFREGRGLMYISGILSTTYLRDMEDEFGIVPLPKADEQQAEYYTWMNLNNSSMLAIPVSNSRQDLTGIVVEALAAESVTTLTPAYFDITLSGKVARDEDSAAMLDIILGSVRFDFANLYDLAGINAIFYKGAQTGVNTFMSDYEAKRSALEIEFEKTMATFDANTSD